MPIRITGMNSGLDTEALVSELVSAYRKKSEKYVKSQKKLSWKQEAWKDLNSKISSFYGSLSGLKFSNSYSMKKATISDSTKATVTAGNGAVAGSYSLRVNKVASAGYLTGAKLDDKVTENSTLAGLGYSGSNGTIEITVGGETKKISVSSKMKVSEFVKELNNVGLKASFDSANHRMYVAASKTGKDNDFTMVGTNAGGVDVLTKLGINVGGEADTTEYRKWANIARNSNGEAYITGYKDGKPITNGVYDAEATKKHIIEQGNQYSSFLSTETTKKAQLEYAKARQTLASNPSDANAQQVVNDYETLMGATSDEVTAVDDAITNGTLDTLISSIDAEITQAQRDISRYAPIKDIETGADVDEYLANITTAAGILDGSTAIKTSAGAVRIAGSDAEIELNGAVYTSDSNDITVNGVTVSALAKTSEPVIVTVTNDAQGMYDKVKKFLKEYNELINEITSLYNAESSKGYEPLTTEEKDALSDSEIEEWEKKIKDSLLRRDSTLESIKSTMVNKMFQSFEINGKKYSLSSFGISTLGILSAKDNEENAFHIDGDSEDSAVSGKTDKLLAMCQQQPEVLAEFMQKLAGGLYDELNSRMSSSTLSSYGVVYNDKEMAREYSDYTKTISKWEKKLEDIEESYYKKFAAMESALATLQAQQSSLASMLGF
ncbi:MAG: flagellar filament capping protein FliD [Roseburia sp.]|nr:flagellar filament capping protein FliD [Roseburia sp.]